jgi:hypothetical protein
MAWSVIIYEAYVCSSHRRLDALFRRAQLDTP